MELLFNAHHLTLFADIQTSIRKTSSFLPYRTVSVGISLTRMAITLIANRMMKHSSRALHYTILWTRHRRLIDELPLLSMLFMLQYAGNVYNRCSFFSMLTHEQHALI